MGTELRTSVVIDYQNVHLTGHGQFASTRTMPRHECLVDPLLFATQLLRARNAAQRPGYDHAVLRRVLVFRGQPAVEHDPKGYARNQAQKSHWERDRRVQVNLRPLKYRYERDADGHRVTDHAGRWIATGKPMEKGVDVMCALATVREAADPATDLVILASSDSDLAPALDEARDLDLAKVETCCWYDVPTRRQAQLRPTDLSRPLWNTRLNETAFRASWDRTLYT